MPEEFSIDSIKVLTGTDPIRLRPKLFFSACFEDENLNLFAFEILCHAIDEYFEGNCTKIHLYIGSQEIRVKYNSGMALHKWPGAKITFAEEILTVMFACSNLKKNLAVGDEFCDLGLCSVVMASEICKVTTVWKNQKGTFSFTEGELNSKSIEPFASADSWTEIYLKPDSSLFPGLFFTFEEIVGKVDALQSRFSGLEWVVEDNNPKNQREEPTTPA